MRRIWNPLWRNLFSLRLLRRAPVVYPQPWIYSRISVYYRKKSSRAYQRETRVHLWENVGGESWPRDRKLEEIEQRRWNERNFTVLCFYFSRYEPPYANLCRSIVRRLFYCPFLFPTRCNIEHRVLSFSPRNDFETFDDYRIARQNDQTFVHLAKRCSCTLRACSKGKLCDSCSKRPETRHGNQSNANKSKFSFTQRNQRRCERVARWNRTINSRFNEVIVLGNSRTGVETERSKMARYFESQRRFPFTTLVPCSSVSFIF